MPAIALLKFVQGATVGGDGQALVGVLTTPVALSNVNNASVASWQIDLLYSDPTSGVVAATPYAFGDSSSTPAAVFSPDVRRSFRWRLKVWSVPNRVGAPDSVDIRVFSVREFNGALIPPSMVWPLPLPDPNTGDPTAKPNEMNFGGQLHGWHGTGTDGLLNDLLSRHMPPLPGSPGDVLTVVAGRWTSTAPSGGSGDVVGPGVSVTGNVAVYADTTGKLLSDGGLALSAFIRHNGSVAFTGNQSMGGFKITLLSNGTAAGDAVNYGQLQAAINGLDPKGNVRAYSITNETLSGLGALGGVASFTDGERVGLSGQTNPIENGIWVKHAGAWTRPADFAAGMDVSGAYFIVEEGTYADREFLVTSNAGAAVVGTNNLVLQDFGSSTLTAGNGLQKIGNVISVLHDGVTLSSSVSGLKIATGGVTGNELAAGSVDLASNKVTGLLPFANIADGAAASLFGRSANSIGVMAPIGSSADGQVLRRAGGSLTFGALDLADTDAVTGLLPLANVASLAALSVLGRASNTAGVMAAITGVDGQALRVSGTTLGFGQLATAAYTDSSVTLAKLANGTAASLLGRSAATGGVYADIASSADGQVMRRAAGVLGFGAVDLADTDAVTGLLPFANIANGSATSVFGRSAGTAGVQASIAASADGQVLQRVAGVLTWSTLTVGTIGGGTAVGQVLTNQVGNVPTWGAVDLADTDAVTGLLAFSNLANGAANSLLGRAAGTVGVQASIAASADGQVMRMAAGALGFGALDLADADAVTGLLPFANLASLTGLSVLGRSTNTLGVMAAITGADGQALRVAGTALGFGQLVTAAYTDSSVTLAKLANGAAASLLGRSAATGGVYADIASSADGQVLRRAGGILDFGALDLADTDGVTGLLAFANMASLAGLSVLGRSGSTSGVMAAITGTANQVLFIDAGGTALTFGTLGTANYTDGSVTLAKLPNATASSVLGRSAATGGVYADITSSADGQVLRRGASGVIAFGAIDLADADARTGLLPFANIANGSALSVFGRASNTAGVMASIVGADGQVLRVSGTTLGFGTVVTAGIEDANVTLAKLAAATGSSVLGRSSTLTGAYADIVASADGQVLRRASGALGWGALDLADADAITGVLGFANMPTLNAFSVLGRASNSAGVMAQIAGTASQILRVNTGGTALGFGTITGASIDANTIALDRLVQSAAAPSVIARAGGTNGNFAELGAASDGQVLRRASGSVAFGAVDLADVDAVTGLLPVTNVAPSGTNGRILVTVGGVPTWGTTFGNTGDVMAITGIAMRLAVAGGTQFEIATLTTGREVISLLLGGAVSTTQMPANTGDKVLFWADATAAPTTGFPAGGGILYVASSLGFQWKGSGGVETTIAQHGDANTTKRRIISFKTQPVRTTGVVASTQFTASSIDCTSVNGVSLINAILRVRARTIAGPGYVSSAEYTGVFQTNGSGVPSNHGSGSLAAGDTGSVGGDGGTQTFDFSGNVIRHRVTPPASNVNTEYLAWMEIDAFEQ